MAPEFTCKDCPDRYPACWDHCEKYQAEKKKHDKKIQASRRNSDIDEYFYKLQARQLIWKMKNRSQGR